MNRVVPRNPSAEFIRRNPHLFKTVFRADPKGEGQLEYLTAKTKRTMAAPALNKTEQRWQDANPSHVPFPLRLRWGNCMHYKPDFMYVVNGNPILIEVKGGHIYDRDIVRFKGCAAEWDWLFEFQLFQWKDKTWKQIY